MATSVEAARSAVLECAEPLGAETVALASAAGRVVARDLVAPQDLPGFANSAMDGFALRAEDTSGADEHSPALLALVGESRAGHPFAGSLERGQAVRISTGAMLPDGADCVLRVEQSRLSDGALVVHHELSRGHDVRPAGDDVRTGQRVLAAGTQLHAGELAMAAALGMTELDVARRPRVAVVSTGDELVAPGRALAPGQIHDSNSLMLQQLARQQGALAEHVAARTADDQSATEAALRSALDASDVLVVVGGVSVGQHDHVKPALQAVGVREIFWQIALRPGHPTWFGQLPRAGGPPTLVFGLPGNPVSAWVTFELFVAPALRRLQGASGTPLRLAARYAGAALAKKPGFAQVLRCRLSSDHGQLVASLTAENQRSHALSSLVGSEALMFLPPESRGIVDGERVDIQPLEPYTWSDK